MDQQLQLPNSALPQESTHTSQEIPASSHTADPEKCLSFVPKKRWRKSAEEFVKALAENKTSPKDNIAAKIVTQESPSSVNCKKESAKRPRYLLSQLIFLPVEHRSYNRDFKISSTILIPDPPPLKLSPKTQKMSA